MSQKKRKKHISAVPFLPNHVVAKKDILKLFSERRKDRGKKQDYSLLRRRLWWKIEREKNPEPVFYPREMVGCVCVRMWKRGDAANSGDIEIDDA